MTPEEIGKALIQGKITRLQLLKYESTISLNYRQQQNWGRHGERNYMLANALSNAFYSVKHSQGPPVKDRTVKTVSKECEVLTFWIREIENALSQEDELKSFNPFPYLA